jgi:hypothetical protein
MSNSCKRNSCWLPADYLPSLHLRYLPSYHVNVVWIWEPGVGSIGRTRASCNRWMNESLETEKYGVYPKEYPTNCLLLLQVRLDHHTRKPNMRHPWFKVEYRAKPSRPWMTASILLIPPVSYRVCWCGRCRHSRCNAAFNFNESNWTSHAIRSTSTITLARCSSRRGLNLRTWHSIHWSNESRFVLHVSLYQIQIRAHVRLPRVVIQSNLQQ